MTIPAEYKTITRQVVDQAPSTRSIPVDAKYSTVTRRAVDQEANMSEVAIPAVYKSVTRTVIDQPASTREIEVPAQYETLTSKVKVAEAQNEWRSILCETNATSAKIMEIQQSLATAGYSPGPIDGKIRSQTMSAVNAYQVAKGLPVDSHLNTETVKVARCVAKIAAGRLQRLQK